jgi:hypothetical protein
MRKYVDKYIREFDECQKIKQGHEYRAPLGEGRQPSYPFEISRMDICGPYLTSANKNRYILIFIDHLTKYTETNPIPDVTTETCENVCDACGREVWHGLSTSDRSRSKFHVIFLKRNMQDPGNKTSKFIRVLYTSKQDYREIPQLS